MNDPKQIIEMMKAIKNPQEYVVNYAKNNNNPIMNNLVKMAQSNDTKGLETFAKNMCQQKGINFDELMSLFK